MLEQRTVSIHPGGRDFRSIADVVVQLTELSCRMDQLEEHWNDPEALRTRLGELAAEQLAIPRD